LLLAVTDPLTCDGSDQTAKNSEAHFGIRAPFQIPGLGRCNTHVHCPFEPKRGGINLIHPCVFFVLEGEWPGRGKGLSTEKPQGCIDMTPHFFRLTMTIHMYITVSKSGQMSQGANSEVRIGIPGCLVNGLRDHDHKTGAASPCAVGQSRFWRLSAGTNRATHVRRYSVLTRRRTAKWWHHRYPRCCHAVSEQVFDRLGSFQRINASLSQTMQQVSHP